MPLNLNSPQSSEPNSNPDEPEELKRCYSCQNVLALSDFDVIKSVKQLAKTGNKSGRYPVCKKCNAMRKKQTAQRKKHQAATLFFKHFLNTNTPPTSNHAYALFTVIHKNSWPVYLPEFNDYQKNNNSRPPNCPWSLEEIEWRIAILNGSFASLPSLPAFDSQTTNLQAEVAQTYNLDLSYSRTKQNGIAPSRQKPLLVPMRPCSQCNQILPTYFRYNEPDFLEELITRAPNSPYAKKFLMAEVLIPYYFKRSYVSSSGWQGTCRVCSGEPIELVERMGTLTPIFKLYQRKFENQESIRNPETAQFETWQAFLDKTFPTIEQFHSPSINKKLPYLFLPEYASTLESIPVPDHDYYDKAKHPTFSGEGI